MEGDEVEATEIWLGGIDGTAFRGPVLARSDDLRSLRRHLSKQYDVDVESTAAELTAQQVNDVSAARSFDGLTIVKAGDLKKAALFQ